MSIVQPDETDTDYELIEEGPSSKVSRTWAAVGSHKPQWVAVKSATVVRKFSKEPHDIAKELRLLSTLSHPNIINILSDSEDPEWSVLHLWMPFIPLSLFDLLASPRFSPHPVSLSSTPSIDEDGETTAALRTQRFTAVARSIMYQTLLGLTYLHGAPHHIAHRDIKPHNILLTHEGCIKLIDFGIAYKEDEDAKEKEGDVWPEARPKLYFEVSTGPYRAPELLFGTRDYDALALDLWSLGATFAEFFTPLRLPPSPSSPFFDEGGEGDYGPHHVGDHTDPPPPFIVSVPGNGNGIVNGSDTRWERETLFNGTRGELGLAWSVFKIRGTPTARNWPAFEHLPDAKGVQFTVVSSVPLAPLLPNLPPTPTPTPAPAELEATPAPANDEEATLDSVHFPREETMSPSPQDLISRFLVYPSENRLRAARALEHPWFTGVGVGCVQLPEGYVVEDGEAMGGGIRMEVEMEMEGKPLGYWVRDVLGCGEE